MENLRITLVQSDIVWHDSKKNIKRFETVIKKNVSGTDLVVLPEMFNTGFTMNPFDAAEDMNGPAVSFLKGLSLDLNADIMGSIAIKENEKFFNRLVWATPSGQIFSYNKRHLFRMGGEDKTYAPGDSLLTVELKGWRIRPFICYDLRFPLWSRNQGPDYDLAVYVANWPAKRNFHWETLLRARAIENLCYVAGVNRTGEDRNGIIYDGKSLVIDYYGETITDAGEDDNVLTAELSMENLMLYRSSFPAWKDSDRFSLL